MKANAKKELLERVNNAINEGKFRWIKKDISDEDNTDFELLIGQSLRVESSSSLTDREGGIISFSLSVASKGVGILHFLEEAEGINREFYRICRDKEQKRAERSEKRRQANHAKSDNAVAEKLLGKLKDK